MKGEIEGIIILATQSYYCGTYFRLLCMRENCYVGFDNKLLYPSFCHMPLSFPLLRTHPLSTLRHTILRHTTLQYNTALHHATTLRYTIVHNNSIPHNTTFQNYTTLLNTERHDITYFNLTLHNSTGCITM
jgi:hypothetical protein